MMKVHSNRLKLAINRTIVNQGNVNQGEVGRPAVKRPGFLESGGGSKRRRQGRGICQPIYGGVGDVPRTEGQAGPAGMAGPAGSAGMTSLAVIAGLAATRIMVIPWFSE